MSDGQGPLVRFKGFSAWYDPSLPPVLKDLNLEINRGELVLVLGATGSGKSALGLCLNGVIPHMQGQVQGALTVGGLDVTETPVSRMATQVGVVFQDVESQICNLYVQDETAFGPENLALSREEVIARVERALAFMGLTELREKTVFELSGGQKQKVAIAAVLAMEPELIFLDEPSANLDPRASREVFQLVARLAREKTMVVVEKKVEEVATLATRVVILDQGTVALDGPPREVFSRHGLRIMDEMGIWIPQATEVALRLDQKRGVFPADVPLHPSEALKYFGRLRFRVTEHSPFNGTVAGEEESSPGQRGGEPLIRADHLMYEYADGTVAVRGVDLEVSRGEILAIVGPNGSGKTTLVKHFVGLLKPTRGKVEVAGKDTRNASTTELAREIGFVFQFPEHQFVKDSVEDEVAFSLRVRGVSDGEVAERLPAMIRVFDLDGLEKRHPFTLSGGQKRRLSVATMLIARPRVLILDEPTYAQDRANTLRIMESLFAAAWREGEAYRPTLILVTHDMRLVAEYATRVVALRLGEKAYDGPTAGLFEDRSLVESVNLEDPPIFDICRRLRAAGVTVPSHITSATDFVTSAVVATGDERDPAK